jgi:hypothetical protein
VASVLGLAIGGSALSGLVGVLVAPGAALDQSNPSRASVCRFTGWLPDDAAGWAAQTFTAGSSGSLTDVVVSLRVGDPRIAVAIAPVDADGRPVVATPLAATSLAVGATTSYVDVDASFPTPAKVEAGKQYAIVVSSASNGAANDWVWKADLGTSTTDPVGTRCGDGAYGGGRFWVSSAPIGADADFFFQTYVVPARHLTVEMTGTGSGLVQDGTRRIDCGVNCTGEFLQGETAILTATADPGSTFSGWSGDGCSGAAPTCSVSVAGDTSVTAHFTRKLVTLTVHRFGRGTVSSLPAGLTCGRLCRHNFLPGPVTLTAKPSKGWRLARWQGGCHGTRPACRITLLHAATVTAIFTAAPHS